MGFAGDPGGGVGAGVSAEAGVEVVESAAAGADTGVVGSAAAALGEVVEADVDRGGNIGVVVFAGARTIMGAAVVDGGAEATVAAGELAPGSGVTVGVDSGVAADPGADDCAEGGVGLRSEVVVDAVVPDGGVAIGFEVDAGSGTGATAPVVLVAVAPGARAESVLDPEVELASDPSGTGAEVGMAMEAGAWPSVPAVSGFPGSSVAGPVSVSRLLVLVLAELGGGASLSGRALALLASSGSTVG